MSVITDETIAVMFADVVDSTKLYDKFGDATAKKIISDGLGLLLDIVTQYNGTLIKTIGDEIMASFPSAAQAVRAAVFMQDVLAQGDAIPDIPEGSFNIRVGLHIGPVIHEKGDIFGNAVNIAARIIKQCKPRQILASRHVIEAAGTEEIVNSRLIDRLTLKGIEEIFEIYEILPSDDQVSSVTAAFSADLIEHFVPATASLHLGFQGKEIIMGVDKRTATLGRHSENELVVVSEGASRLHATIEYNRNKFILKDQSINGTFITNKAGTVTKLHRDETVIEGEGTIALGRQLPPDSPHVIHFRVE